MASRRVVFLASVLLVVLSSAFLYTKFGVDVQAESRYSLFTAPHPTDVASNIDHLDVESSSVSPSASPTFPLFTRHSCTRSMGTWGEVCVYHDVCWDGESWLVLKEDGERDHRTAGMHRGTDDQLEGLIFPRDLAPFDYMAKFSPLNSNTNTKFVHPLNLSQSARITRYHGNAWRLALRYSISNVWYLASRVLPLYTALRMNDTGELSLPPLERDDVIFAVCDGAPLRDDWYQTMLAVASREHPRFEFRDGDWGKQWTPDNVVCMDTAVALSSIGPVMPDMETGFAFREDVYKRFYRQVPSKPVLKVLFWLRPNPFPRAIINAGELFQVLESYNIPYTVMFDFPSLFADQLSLFATHGILVSAHGAGLTNMIFLPPMASVIELFQVQHDHNLYSLLAMMMGIGHYPVHARNGSEMWATNTVHWEHDCERLSSLEMNHISAYCRGGAVYYRVRVPVREFEVALINAVNHAGYKVKLHPASP